KPRARDRAQGGRVVALERSEQGAIEVLVHHEVAETTRGDDGDRRIFFPRADRIRDGLADRKRAARRWLVRQVAGVLEDRENRHGLVVEEPLHDERERVRQPLLARGGLAHVVELALL